MFICWRWTLLTLMLAGGISAFGQSQRPGVIDSLLSELPKYKGDTHRANLLDKLAFAYSRVSPDEGIKYGRELYELSSHLKWQLGIAKANAVLGINYAAKSDQRNAIHHYNNALKISKVIGDSPRIAGNTANISIVYLSQGNYPKALALAFEALGIYEARNDAKNVAILNENIGAIYYDQKEYEKAMRYYSAALNGYQLIKDNAGIARCYGNIGSVLGATGELGKALKNHQMALETNRQLGNRYSVQVNLANIGVIRYRMGEYDAALDNHFAALRISDEMGDKNSSAINMGNIGEVYLAMASGEQDSKGANVPGSKTENIKLAIKYLLRSTNQCKELNFSGPYVEFSKVLSEAYAAAGDHKKALEAFRDHTRLKDSLFTVQSKLEVAALEMKRHEELRSKDLLIRRNEKDISRLIAAQQRNRILLIFSCVLAVVLLILFILKSLFAYRRSNKLLSLEKEHHLKHIKTQEELLEEIAHIQAHEVSGPVATILGLVKVFDQNNPSEPTNLTIIKGITEVTEVLDEKVKEVIRKKNAMEKL